MATRVEVLPAPEERLSAWQWARRNLFDGWLNTLLTLLTGAALVSFVSAILRWAARAHWSVITDNPRFWLMGLMPVELAPRAFWAGGLVAAAALLTLGGVRVRVAPRVLFGLWVGIIIAAAYVGEIVRAGIQSVPRGQTEAARAVGLSAVQTMRFIVLPQAVKNMIPSLV